MRAFFSVYDGEVPCPGHLSGFYHDFFLTQTSEAALSRRLPRVRFPVSPTFLAQIDPGLQNRAFSLGGGRFGHWITSPLGIQFPRDPAHVAATDICNNP